MQASVTWKIEVRFAALKSNMAGRELGQDQKRLLVQKFLLKRVS